MSTALARQPIGIPTPLPARVLFLAARPAVASTFQQTLGHDCGIDLDLVLDPDEVVAAAVATPPDLILLDLPWAGRAGERLVQRLRACGCRARLAVVGDRSGARGREAARRLGAIGFTPDPASRDLLKVLRSLARPQPRGLVRLRAA